MDLINNKDYISAEISLEDPQTNALKSLIGKQIVDIGFVKGVEGGLCIDYKEEKQVKRCILGFNELGMWIEWHGEKGVFNQSDKLKLKLEKWLMSLSLLSVKIIHNYLVGTFDFVDENDNKLTLSIKELKVISEKYPDIFKEIYATKRDVGKVVTIINDYCYGF